MMVSAKKILRTGRQKKAHAARLKYVATALFHIHAALLFFKLKRLDNWVFSQQTVLFHVYDTTTGKECGEITKGMTPTMADLIKHKKKLERSLLTPTT